MSREIDIESLMICPEYLGGIAARIWYAPISYFSKMTIPQQGDFAQNKKIEIEDLALKYGKSLAFIDVFLEQNSLTEKMQGNSRKWKLVSEFSFSILGMKAENLGFIKQIKNEGLVFIIPDNNGCHWVLGSMKNPAYLNNYEGNTNRKTDDDPLLSISFIAHTEILQYAGSVEDILMAGAFSKGFSSGFKISKRIQ